MIYLWNEQQQQQQLKTTEAIQKSFQQRKKKKEKEKNQVTFNNDDEHYLSVKNECERKKTNIILFWYQVIRLNWMANDMICWWKINK